MQTLREFMESYEVERKFDTIFMIVNGRLREMNFKPLIGISLFDKYLDYIVVNWTHDNTHCIIHIESDYHRWTSVNELRKMI